MSAAFDAALKGAHVLALEVTVLESGLKVATINPTGGGVTLDAAAAVRGRLDLTINDPDLIPVDEGSLLAPYGNEIQVKRGLEFADGSQELSSLGIFRIEEAPVSDTGDEVSVRVAGLDRAARVAEAKFEVDVKIKAGQLFTDVILNLVREVIPDVRANFAETSITTPAITASAGDDRWAFVQSMATAIGAELFFDGDGILTLCPIASATGTPTATIAEGDGGLLLSIDKGFSRERVHNRVIVTGNGHADNPIRGVATDDNPTSPTMYGGKFGKKPFFYDSQFITKQVQADDAAGGILQTMIGVDQEVDFTSVVDPRLAPSDVIQVTRARIGVDELHVLDSLTIPLAATDAASGTTRKTAVFGE